MARTTLDVQRSLKRHVAEALMAADPAWEVRLAEEQGAFERPFAMVYATGEALTAGSRSYRDVLQPYMVTAYALPGDSPAAGRANAGVAEDALWRAFNVGVQALPPPTAVTVTAGVGAGLTGTFYYAATAYDRHGTAESTPLVATPITLADDPARVTVGDAPGATGYRIYRGASAGDLRLVGRVARGATFVDAGAVAGTKAPPSTPVGFVGGPLRIPLWSYDGVPIEPTATDLTPWREPPDFIHVRDVSILPTPDTDDPTLWSVACAVRLGWTRLGRVPSEQQLVTSVKAIPDTGAM